MIYAHFFVVHHVIILAEYRQHLQAPASRILFSVQTDNRAVQRDTRTPSLTRAVNEIKQRYMPTVQIKPDSDKWSIETTESLCAASAWCESLLYHLLAETRCQFGWSLASTSKELKLISTYIVTHVIVFTLRMTHPIEWSACLGDDNSQAQLFDTLRNRTDQMSGRKFCSYKKQKDNFITYDVILM